MRSEQKEACGSEKQGETGRTRFLRKTTCSLLIVKFEVNVGLSTKDLKRLLATAGFPGPRVGWGLPFC